MNAPATNGDGGSTATGGSGAGGRTGTGGDATGGATTTSAKPACTVVAPLSEGTEHCSSGAQGDLPGGFQWSVWSSGSDGCIIIYDTGCAFKATWDIGIYGWSKNPLIEFYIVDDWFSKTTPGTKVGTITADGDTYTVYKNTRTNAPSIEGHSTFDAKLGLNLGRMYEAKILAEAGDGSGSVDFTSATMTISK